MEGIHGGSLLYYRLVVCLAVRVFTQFCSVFIPFHAVFIPYKNSIIGQELLLFGCFLTVHGFLFFNRCLWWCDFTVFIVFIVFIIVFIVLLISSFHFLNARIDGLLILD